MLRIAETYARRGWSLVPIPLRSKKPVIPGWQKLRLRIGDLAHYFQGDQQNIGVLLGEPSGGLVDVDLDHPLAVELADQYLPSTPSEFGRQTKPRSHRLFVVTEPVATYKRKLPGGKMIVELRSTGCQTVFPGSVHPGGEPIRWNRDDAPEVVDPGDLRTKVDALANEILRRLGLHSRAFVARCDAPITARRSAPPGSLDRARKYIARISPAVSGQDGHNATFRVACVLVLTLHLSREEALTVLREWNHSCVPPWSDKELEHKIDDVLKLPSDRRSRRHPAIAKAYRHAVRHRARHRAGRAR